MSPSSIRIALRLHPRWWRERYLDEVEVVSADLLGEGRPAWRLAAGLYFDALRQWVRGPILDTMPTSGLRSQLAGAGAALPFALVLPLVMYTMMAQTYRSSTVLQVSGSPTLDLTWPTPDTFTFRKFEDIQHGSTFILGRTGPLVHGSMSWATYVSGVGAFLIGWLTVLLLIGLLVAWGCVRFSIRKTATPRRTWRVLSWTPGIALIFVSTIFLWVNHLNQQPVSKSVIRSGHPVVSMSIAHPTLARVLGDVNLTLGLGLWIGAAVSLTYLASHVEVDSRDSWLPITISRFVGRAMPLFLIAYGLWIVGLRSQKPPAVPGQVVVSYVHSGWWPLAIAALVLATVISLRGAAALTTIHRQTPAISVPVSSD